MPRSNLYWKHWFWIELRFIYFSTKSIKISFLFDYEASEKSSSQIDKHDGVMMTSLHLILLIQVHLFCFSPLISRWCPRPETWSKFPEATFLKSLNDQKHGRQPLEHVAQVYCRLVKERTGNHMDTRWWGWKGQDRFTRRGFHYPVTYKKQTECPMMREGPQFYYTAAAAFLLSLFYTQLDSFTLF